LSFRAVRFFLPFNEFYPNLPGASVAVMRFRCPVGSYSA
jgi:hypothetical protein